MRSAIGGCVAKSPPSPPGSSGCTMKSGLAIVGAASLVVNGFLVGHVVKRLGEYNTLPTGLGFGIISELLFLSASNHRRFLAMN